LHISEGGVDLLLSGSAKIKQVALSGGNIFGKLLNMVRYYLFFEITKVLFNRMSVQKKYVIGECYIAVGD